MKWQTTVLENASLFQRCAFNNNFFANNYGAVNFILYEKKYKSKISIDGEWIYEKFFDDGKICYGFPHNVNGDLSEIKNALENLVEDSKISQHDCIFKNICSEEKEILSGLYKSLEIENAPALGDYIYLSENLANLPGKKYSKKRNHVHQFTKIHPDYRFEILCSTNLESAREVEKNWLEENYAKIDRENFLEDLIGEEKIIESALDNFEHFSKTCGMSGGIIFVQDKPIAFCLSSFLSSSVTDIHFEKCLSTFAQDGGYSVICNEFSKTVSTKYINREEDLGMEGLRKAKLSYHPEFVMEKYNVRLLAG